jgi:hypothetical protein
MDQFAIDLSTHFHLDQAIVHITGNARGGTELDALVRQNVPFDGPVEYNVGHGDRPLDHPTVADAQGRTRLCGRIDITLHMAVDVEATGELHIADDASAGTD